MPAASETHTAAPSTQVLTRLYLRHRQGGWVRAGASAVMGVVAGVGFARGYLGTGQLIGIMASILVLILMNPPILWVLARARSLRFIKYFSLGVNLLEVTVYTAVIHFVGGLEASFLSVIYFILIGYLGMTAPRQVPFLIAGWSAICLLVMVVLETSGLVPVAISPVPGGVSRPPLPWDNQLLIVAAIAIELLVMAYISSYTAGVLERGRHRLRESNLALEQELEQRRRDQEELRRANETLEVRVEERTANLREVNDRLSEEITERKQTEEALRESEARYALATEAARIGVWDWDLATGLFESDPGIWKQLGYELHQIKWLSREWAGQVVHPDDRLRWMEIAVAVQQGRLDDFEIEYRARHVDGHDLWYLSRASVIRDQTGAPVKVIGSTIDIDDRKQVETRLQASEQKFSAAFKSSPAIVSLSTLDGGRFLDANDNFLRMLGYTRSEVIGRTSAELNIWASSEDRARVLAAMVNGEVQDLEVLIRDKAGDLRQLLWSGSVVEMDGRKVLLTSAVDITDRKRAEQERDRLIGELKEALDKVRTLRGLIPICAYCKKVRDDEGYWHQVEAYVKAHSEAVFSHGLCPDCLREHYPEYAAELEATPDEPKA
jgi:PAS domain S-box-containing protein